MVKVRYKTWGSIPSKPKVIWFVLQDCTFSPSFLCCHLCVHCFSLFLDIFGCKPVDKRSQRSYTQCKMALRVSAQFSVYLKTAHFVVSMTCLIVAIKEEHKFDICFAIHDGVPPLKVVLVARETIYEEPELFLIFLHGLFHCLARQTQQQT